MAQWYYYNESGEKIEVTGGQLKELAKAGTITRDTIVETEEGKTAPARRVKDLTFLETTQPESEQEVAPSEPKTKTSNWFYYNENGERIAVTGGQLKGLAKAGMITPGTLVETEDGKKTLAKTVKGLTFVAAAPAVRESVPPDSTSLPDANPFMLALPTDNPFAVPPADENPFVLAPMVDETELQNESVSPHAEQEYTEEISEVEPYEGKANHRNTNFPLGFTSGTLTLTPQSLIFMAVCFNPDQNYTLTMPLEQCMSVTADNVLFMPGISIEMKDGYAEKFSVWSREIWIDKIQQAILFWKAQLRRENEQRYRDMELPKTMPPVDALPVVEKPSANVDSQTVEKIDSVNGVDENGSTALHEAVIIEDLDRVKFLVSRGYEIDTKNNVGMTPLHLAAMFNKGTEISTILTCCGADIHAVGNGGITPLHCAIANCKMNDRDIEVVKLLISHGADICAKNNAGKTPHDIVKSWNHIELIEYFSSLQQDLAPPAAVPPTTTSSVVENLPTDAKSQTVEKMGGVDDVDENGSTKLHAMVFGENFAGVKFLVSTAGADVNARNNEGQTPLHFAAMFNNGIDIAQFLIAKGSDVNAKGNAAMTPLMFAVLACGALPDKDIGVVKYLISQGADIHAKNESGLSSLDFMKISTNTALVEYFSSLT